MPKPDERNSRTAARKSGLIKTPAQQSAFAAQNLEDMVMYDVERVRNFCLCYFYEFFVPFKKIHSITDNDNNNDFDALKNTIFS